MCDVSEMVYFIQIIVALPLDCMTMSVQLYRAEP